MTEEAQVIQADRDRLLEILALWDLGRKEEALAELARHRIAAEPLITPPEPAQLSAALNQADREKLVRAVVERCAEVADEEKISAQQMRDAARKEKDGQGAFVHAADASAAFCIASAIRSLNIDDLVKEARK